ncbi:MAG: O-antigen ligase family protein [Candidatus Omnitrophica bacterium]|nr:O-antigen ligase family protein [Candidatus Omnitrophota bacterium]
MKKLFGLLKIIDNNLIKSLLIGFIFFVPLWPKLPLKMINYTYISIRLDDIYLGVMTFAFFIQLLRKKVKLNKKFFILFLLFWLAVFLSSFWGILISKTITFWHLGILHSLRRVEYMIVFFIALSVIKNKKDFFKLINIYLLSVFLVILYGFGQKFLNFPAVQTMNPEYAKGYLLYLTPEARISSTFAGHYDLASYLVFAIPITLGFYFFTKNKNYLALFILSLIILIYTSSRISFGAYVISTIGFLIFIRKYWFTIFVIFLTATLMFATGELTKRFLKTFQVRRILIDEKTGAVYIGQKITTKELPAGSFYIKLKDQKTGAEENLEEFKKQVINEKLKEATLSGQITKKEENIYLSTLSANLKPVNTVVSDISFATRLQIEWPRAINAFKRNFLLGTGPSSITEATDNDYLRWLGEIGIIGTFLFSLIIYYLLKTVWTTNLINLGFIFSIGALLINATYIDVFEASKVAYTFWTIAGLFIGYTTLKKQKFN